MLNDFERKLLELWKTGKSTMKIAQELKVTKNIICGKIFRMRKRGVDLPPRGTGMKPQGERNPRVYKPKVKTDAPLIDLIFKKQKEEKVRPIIVLKEAALAKPRNIKFKHLTAKSCRYIVNDGRPENFIFCGAPKERGPYCEAHARICYMPPKIPAKEYQRANNRFK